MSKNSISIAEINRGFETYTRANREMVADGHMSTKEESIINAAGQCVVSLVTQNPGLCELEFKALLTKAQDFGKLLCGAIDHAKGIDSPRVSYYKAELVPVMLDYLAFMAQTGEETSSEPVEA